MHTVRNLFSSFLNIFWMVWDRYQKNFQTLNSGRCRYSFNTVKKQKQNRKPCTVKNNYKKQCFSYILARKKDIANIFAYSKSVRSNRYVVKFWRKSEIYFWNERVEAWKFFSLVEFKFVHEFCIIIYKVKQYFHPSSLNHLIMYMRTCNAESQKRSATFWYLVWWPGGSWLSGAAWLGRTRRGRPCCWQCGHTPHLYTHNTINQWKS